MLTEVEGTLRDLKSLQPDIIKSMEKVLNKHNIIIVKIAWVLLPEFSFVCRSIFARVSRLKTTSISNEGCKLLVPASLDILIYI